MKTLPYVYSPVEVVRSNERMLINQYISQWRWFLLSFVGLLGLGYGWVLFTEPRYRIQASVLVRDEQKGLTQESVMKELDLFKPNQVVENEIEVLRSVELMGNVVDRLRLGVRYYRQTPFGDRELYQTVPVRLIPEAPLSLLYHTTLFVTVMDTATVRLGDHSYPINQSVTTPYGRLRFMVVEPLIITSDPIIVRVTERGKAIQSYLSRLKVEPSNKTSTVLLLTLEEAVPRKGEVILNQLITEYNSAAITDKNRQVANTTDFIEARLRLVAGELKDVEQRVERYKSLNHITDISAESQVITQQMQTNDAQLNQTNLQLGALGDIERYIQQKTDGQGVVPATLGISDPTLLVLIGKTTELELQREQMARTTSDLNPMLRTIDDQISVTKSNINELVASMRNALTNTKQQLLATNNRYVALIRVMPTKERVLMDITRQQAIKSNLYTYLLQKREETALSFASTVSDSRIINWAHSGQDPVAPIKSLILLLFGTIGLLLPMLVIAAKDVLNERVVGRADVNNATQTPVVGEISYVQYKNPVIMNGLGRSATAEQIRALRTNLQYMRTGDESLVLLLTSSISGEGKSFISLNLGASLGLTKRRTVILEMDFRRPKLHTMLGIDNQLGLSNYLMGDTDLDAVLQPVPGVPDYWIITSGTPPDNPAELLTSPRLKALFSQLRERFDFVLADAPPIGLVTDAHIIAEHTDATLYVIRCNLTPRQSLHSVDALFREQRLRNMKIVLNAVSTVQHKGNNYYNQQEKSISI